MKKTEGFQVDTKKFCFSCVLIEFRLKFTSEQIDQMFELVTQDQLNMINNRLDIEEEENDGSSWY